MRLVTKTWHLDIRAGWQFVIKENLVYEDWVVTGCVTVWYQSDGFQLSHLWVCLSVDMRSEWWLSTLDPLGKFRVKVSIKSRWFSTHEPLGMREWRHWRSKDRVGSGSSDFRVEVSYVLSQTFDVGWQLDQGDSADLASPSNLNKNQSEPIDWARMVDQAT